MTISARVKWLEANVQTVPKMMDVAPHLERAENNLKLLIRSAAKPESSG